MPLKGKIAKTGASGVQKKLSSGSSKVAPKASVASKKSKKAVPVSPESSSDSEEFVMRSASDMSDSGSEEVTQSKKVYGIRVCPP